MASSNPNILSRDVAYAICASACRRRLLEHLLPGERHSVDDLARELRRTMDDPSERLDSRDAGALEIALVHIHLPYLDDHDVIDYRPTQNAIVVPESVGDRFPSALATGLGLNAGAGDELSQGDDATSSS